MATASEPWRPGAPARPGAAKAPASAIDGAALTARLRELAASSELPLDALEQSLRAVVDASGAGAGAICLYDTRQEMLRLAAEHGLSDEGCRRLRTVRRGDAASWDMPLHGLLNRRAYLIDSAAKNRYVPPLVEGAALVRSVVCVPVYQGANALGSLLVVSTGARMLNERDIHDLEPSLRELAALIEAIRLRAPTVTQPTRAAATVTPIAAGPTNDPTAPRARPAGDPDDADSPSAVLMEVIDLRAKVQELKAQVADAEAAAQEEGTRATELEAKLRQATTALDAGQARERALEKQLGEARREDLPTRLVQVEARAQEQTKRAADLEARLAEVETRAAGRQQVLEKLTASAEELKARLAATEASLGAEKKRADEAERAGATERESQAATQTQAAGELTVTVADLKKRLAETEASLAAEKARADEAGGATAEGREYADAELAAARTVIEHMRRELAERKSQIERLEPAALGAEALERELRGTREREMELRTKLEAQEAVAAAPRATASPTPAAGSATPVADAPAAAASAAPPKGVIIVVDTGGGWARLGAGVRVEAPDDDLAARIEKTAGRILVNLAAPGALRALAQVRAAGSTRRFWGCLATSDAARALPLGMIEPAVRPLAPEALVELLAGYANRGTRVVTLGRDIDAFGGFRESMARQGLSVSMAWDAKQAADVIAMVRPEVAVVDLDSLREGCAIIAGLAGAEPLPHFVLLFGAKDLAPAFAHAVRDPAHASRALPLDRLVAQLAKRNESRPAERK
jgi:hypothetical protein